MAYITYQQYSQIYGVAPDVSEDQFPLYANMASDLIDAETQYRIQKQGGLSALPEWIQLLVQKACCLQIIYFVQNGLYETTAGQAGKGFTVGKVSVSGANTGNATGAQLMISPAAKALLEQTGLMYRSVSTIGFGIGWGGYLC